MSWTPFYGRRGILARIDWQPQDERGHRWLLVLTLEWRRTIGEVRRTASGWEVPVLGGRLGFMLDDMDRAVEKAEREGLGRFGLQAPGGWRRERAQRNRLREPEPPW